MSDLHENTKPFSGTIGPEVAPVYRGLTSSARLRYSGYSCNTNHHLGGNARNLANVSALSGVFDEMDGRHYQVIPVGGAYSPCLSGIKFYFVNGIINPYHNAVESAQEIADLVGANIHLVYSKTEGLLKDIIVAVQIASGKIKSPAVTEVAKRVRCDLMRDKKVVIIAHSRGAAVVQSAIESLRLSEQQGQNLAIVTLGGFSKPSERWYIPKTAMLVAYQNYTEEIYSDEKLGIYKKRVDDMVPVLKHLMGDGFDAVDWLKIPFAAIPVIDFGLRVKKLHVVDSYFDSITDFIKRYARNQRHRTPTISVIR